MTFSSRPRSLARWTLWTPSALAPLALVLVLAAGCADKHIGRPCDLGPAGVDAGQPGTGTSATIYSGALECPSRICLLPSNDNNSADGPMCTDTCSSDGDCDGENIKCKTGFKCLIANTVGPLCCRKLCVCKDFVDLTNVQNEQNTAQTACMPSPTNACENAH